MGLDQRMGGGTAIFGTAPSPFITDPKYGARINSSKLVMRETREVGACKANLIHFGSAS
jgi:hypothetical protein